jgi:hypothetical protein
MTMKMNLKDLYIKRKRMKMELRMDMKTMTFNNTLATEKIKEESLPGKMKKMTKM